MPSRSSTTLLKAMRTNTSNGPHCGRDETKMCQSSQKNFIPFVHSWVSKILSCICTQIQWLPTQIHPRRDGVLEHLLTRHSIPIRCQNRAKVQTKEARLWICKSEAQRTKPRWGDPRQPLEAARKEQHHEAEEGHRKVV